MTRVYVVGAGAVASTLAHFLEKDSEIEFVTFGTNNLSRAALFIAPHKKIKIERLDAGRIADVTSAIQGYDVVINASLPRFNKNVLSAALQARVPYMDLASELRDLKEPEQLGFHKEFADAGISALINAGISPGITNMLARDASDKFDSIDSIQFRCFEDQKASEFIFSWSPETTYDELISAPLIYIDGVYKHTQPLCDPEDYEYPSPYGVRRAYGIYGDEVSTIPRYIRVNKVDYKAAGADIELPKIMKGIGLFETKKIPVGNIQVAPIDVFKATVRPMPTPKEMLELINDRVIEDAVFISSVAVAGEKEDKNIRIMENVIYPTLCEITSMLPGATYISYPTGLAAYAFLKVLAHYGEPGVHPPETLSEDARTEVMLILEQNGVKIEKIYQKA